MLKQIAAELRAIGKNKEADFIVRLAAVQYVDEQGMVNKPEELGVDPTDDMKAPDEVQSKGKKLKKQVINPSGTSPTVARQAAGAEGMRFDCNARVEIWVTWDDITEHADFQAIMDSDKSDEEKRTALRAIAQSIAFDRTVGINEVEITADVSVSDINIDRIDYWGHFEDYKQDKLDMEAKELNEPKTEL